MLFNRSIYVNILFFVTILMAPKVYSQNERLSFEEFVIEDGLASVNCILKDNEGFMWFGGTHGLYRFDGYGFKIFTANDDKPNTLSNSNITSLYQDSEGLIWVGTMRGGLNCYNPKTETFINYKNSKLPIYNNNYVTCISGNTDNIIWIGTFDNGLFRFDKQNKTHNNYNKSNANLNSISNNSVFSIVVDNNNVWIATNSGILDCYNSISKTFTYYKYYDADFQSTRTGQRLCLDSFHNLWIATEGNGLYKFNTISKSLEHFEHLKNKNSLSSNEITDIKEGKPGEVWLTTFGGLNKLNTESEKFSVYQSDVYNQYSITNNVSYCLFIDNNNVVWMGMGDGTVNKTIQSPFEIYQTSFTKNEYNINYNIITSLYLKNNELLIGTGGGGMDKLNLNTGIFHNYSNNPLEKSSLPSDIVMTVIKDDNNTIWTGNFKNSLIGYKTDNNEGFFEASFSSDIHDNLNNVSVFDLAKDNDNNIWIATYNNGLYKYNIPSKTLKHYNRENTNNQLISNKLLRLLIDSSNNLWIGSLDKGIQIFEQKDNTFHNLKDFGFNDALDLNYPIKDIYEDGDDNIWIATEGKGIFIISTKSKTIQEISTKQGLPSNSVYGIIQDNDKNFWFSSNKGIINYNTDTKKFYIYNSSDGLPSNDFESGAIAKAKDGKLFFGSKRGLIAFYPKNLKSTSSSLNLTLTNFRIFNNDINVFDIIENHQPLDSSISHKKTIKLPYFLNNFGVEFAVPGHHAPHNVDYQYQLEGIDNRWLNASSEQHFVSYSNIPHGKYTFKVKAFDENNLEHPTSIEKHLKIEITPVWWQTNFAYLLYVSLILFLAIYIYNNVKSRVHLKNELLIEKYKHEKDEELHQAKINFFTTISHELRTSLTLILSPLQQLSTVNTNNKAYNLIMTMNRNGQRLLNLINQVLDFRKLESSVTKLNVTHTNLKSFFKEICIPFYQYAEEKQIQFELTVSNSCQVGWIDNGKMEIVLYNIISNAFKHTSNKVDLNVDLDEKDERLIIRIKDNGSGINEDDVTKIFQKFYQVKHKEDYDNSGSGLGLAITKNLIDVHYGDISVKSEKGLYTVFIISIPILKSFYNGDEINNHEENDIYIESLEKEIKLVSKNNNTVATTKPILLIIEDHFEIRNLIKNHFLNEFTIHTSPNGEDGKEKALKLIPDIIISDIMMPKLNGLELCKMLKTDNRTSHIPILLLTARGSLAFKMEGFEHGADDYITKPFNLNVLDIRVKNLIKTRQLLREKFKKETLLNPAEVAINNVDEAFIEKTMKIIEDNISNPKFSVSNLASKIGMSHSVLYRKIVALTGENVNELIKTMRLIKAEQLILKGNFTINEISDMTGFSNPKYFSTCFKKKYGTTPSKYVKHYE